MYFGRNNDPAGSLFLPNNSIVPRERLNTGCGLDWNVPKSAHFRMRCDKSLKRLSGCRAADA
jgi:hypothetical protein